MLLFPGRRAKRFDHTEEGRQVRKKPASAGEVVDDRERVEAVEMGELAEASETVDLAAFVSAPPFAGPLPPSLARHRSKSNHGRDEFLNIPPGKKQRRRRFPQAEKTNSASQAGFNGFCRETFFLSCRIARPISTTLARLPIISALA